MKHRDDGSDVLGRAWAQTLRGVDKKEAPLVFPQKRLHLQKKPDITVRQSACMKHTCLHTFLRAGKAVTRVLHEQNGHR